MHEVAKIDVKRIGLQSSEISIFYQTPEWARVIEQGGIGTLVPLLWLSGSAALLWGTYQNIFDLPTGKNIVALFVGSSLVYWLGWNLNRLLQKHREKSGLVHDRLQIEISPHGFKALGPGIDFNLEREDEMIFTALPHQGGRREERDEQRVQRRLGHTFRDAFEIWVQTGHHFERIAAVFDEKSARAITRYCQEADERASRGHQQHDAATNRTEPV